MIVIFIFKHSRKGIRVWFRFFCLVDLASFFIIVLFLVFKISMWFREGSTVFLDIKNFFKKNWPKNHFP